MKFLFVPFLLVVQFVLSGHSVVTTYENVSIRAEGIFINIHGTEYLAESICQANEGFLVAQIPDYKVWYCRKCGTHTPYGFEKC